MDNKTIMYIIFLIVSLISIILTLTLVISGQPWAITWWVISVILFVLLNVYLFKADMFDKNKDVHKIIFGLLLAAQLIFLVCSLISLWYVNNIGTYIVAYIFIGLSAIAGFFVIADM